MIEIPAYTEYLRALLPAQFRDGDNWNKLLAVIGEAMDAREADVQTLLEARTDIDSATGILLDQWGALFGLLRAGRSDDLYRSRLVAWMQALTSQGTPEEMISIARELSSGEAVTYWETPPATFSLELPGPLYSTSSEQAREIVAFITKGRPAGVSLGEIIDRVTDAARYDVASVGFDLGNFAIDLKGA